jgi:hypothetical protein
MWHRLRRRFGASTLVAVFIAVLAFAATGAGGGLARATTDCRRSPPARRSTRAHDACALRARGRVSAACSTVRPRRPVVASASKSSS